jgi:four helix bundle protein
VASWKSKEVAGGQLTVKLRDYTELVAWQKAMDFVEAVYQVSKAFPKDELFGLTSQVRRAAVFIPSNIAEGLSRRSSREFLQFLSIARGSLSEVETQLIISKRSNYLSPEQLTDLEHKSAELGRVLNGLTNAIQKRS